MARALKYEHQWKTYEHDYDTTIYLITNMVSKRSFREQYYYVGQTSDEYTRLSKHNRNEQSGAYLILQNGGAMYTLGAIDSGYYLDNHNNWKHYEDTYESILISLVNYITADYSPYKSYITNRADYDKISVLRYKLSKLKLFTICLDEEFIKSISKYKFDENNYKQMCELITKYHEEQLDEDSISCWATIMTLAKIQPSDYEETYLNHLKWLETEEKNRMYYYD